MRKFLRSSFPKLIHSPYELTNRYKKITPELQTLLMYISTNDFKNYNKFITGRSLDERINLMEMIYSNGKILKELNFVKFILDPFTSDLNPRDFKGMNLRLSYMYYKWYNYAINHPIILTTENWNNFFDQHGPYYKEAWNKDLPDYLLSLMFTPTAFNHSKDYANIIMRSTDLILKNGFPTEIGIQSDAHRALLKKIRFMSNINNMALFYLNLTTKYFENLREMNDGKFKAVVFEFLNLYEDMDKIFSQEYMESLFANVSKELTYRNKENLILVNEILTMISQRSIPIKSHNVLLRLIDPLITSFKDLDEASVYSYGRICLRSRKPSLILKNKEYLSLIKEKIKENKLNCEFGNYLIKYQLKFPFLPYYILSDLEKWAEANKFKFSDLSITSEVVKYLENYKPVSPMYGDCFTKLIENPKSISDYSYIRLIIKIATDYLMIDDLSNQKFWYKFIELISNEEQIKGIRKSEITKLIMAILLLKKTHYGDMSTLIKNDFWTQLLNLSKEQLLSRENEYIKCIDNYISRHASVIKYQYDYKHWMFPLVIPKIKLAFVDKNSIVIQYYMKLATMLKKSGWTIMIIAPGSPTNVEANKFIEKFVIPVLKKKNVKLSEKELEPKEMEELKKEEMRKEEMEERKSKEQHLNQEQ